MLIDELFEKFDTYEKLWIGINDIRDQIVDLNVQDEINFHFVTMDEDAVRGFLHQHTVRENLYTDPKLVSDIYIANSLDENWRRLVAAKELLHILDTNVTRAQSNEAVEKLLDNLSLPPEVRQHTNSYFNDQARLISALAILVPKECRIILRRLSSEGIIGSSDVSRMAKIPNRFGQMILDDDFEELFNIIHKAGNGK